MEPGCQLVAAVVRLRAIPAAALLAALVLGAALGAAPATATAATLCEQGNYSATGEVPCKEAPPGFYAAGPGAKSATPCPAGTNNPHMRAISEDLCESDAPGSWSGPGAASPSLCEPGSYAPQSRAVQCTPTPAGSYDEGAGSSSPEPCPAGSYASQTRAVQCTPTPAGTYATGGAFAPTPCPTGTEAPAGASSCKTITSLPGESTPIIPITFTFAAPHRQSSLSHTRSQGYVLRCSATDIVSAHVSLTITLRHQHLRLQAPARTIACRAGVSASERAHFKLTGAARRLLARRGATIRLAIVLYPLSAGAKTALATGSVRGSR